ncbi:hypothetical protein V6N11_020462 [Hibiscus sabdariffa]|uniref:Uncharacterized protein n=1 Tax=Hibiscus sabdariffa TaxID=183260 RepID=A0ABR2Q8G7_9ROSI
MGQTVVGLATAGLKGRAGPERVGCLTRRPTRAPTAGDTKTDDGSEHGSSEGATGCGRGVREGQPWVLAEVCRQGTIGGGNSREAGTMGQHI